MGRFTDLAKILHVNFVRVSKHKIDIFQNEIYFA